MNKLPAILTIVFLCIIIPIPAVAETPMFAAIPWFRLSEDTVIPHPIRSGWVERLIENSADRGMVIPRISATNVDFGALRIEIYKSQFVLILYSGDDVVRVYPVALSGNPIGHKIRMGDKKTPEGRYKVLKYRSPSYGPSLYVSYPSRADALRGFLTGTIAYTQFRRIEFAEELTMIPPSDTPLGGKILIHTVDEMERTCATCENWSMGCIVLEPKDMRELLSVIPWFTPLDLTIFSVDLDLDISIASSLDATAGSGADNTGD